MRQDAGDDQACLDWLEQALRFHPTSREIVLAFHERLNALERLARGEDAFRAVLREHPLNRRLRFLLIDILLRQGKLDSAMAEIESAMADFGVDPGMLAAAQSVRERVGPRRGAGGMDSVSLCMIVKNEEANLARCLRSVTPVVDEIVIVDTGSTDRTRDIATAFGARVADVPWNDDFQQFETPAWKWLAASGSSFSTPMRCSRREITIDSGRRSARQQPAPRHSVCGRATTRDT